MPMLHTINKSPFERNSLDSCLRVSNKGGSILFIEDGVFAAMKGTSVADKVSAAVKDFSIYVLGPDLKARGMDESQLLDDIKVIDYGGFVDLVAECDKVQSWL